MIEYKYYIFYDNDLSDGLTMFITKQVHEQSMIDIYSVNCPIYSREVPIDHYIDLEYNKWTQCKTKSRIVGVLFD